MLVTQVLGSVIVVREKKPPVSLQRTFKNWSQTESHERTWVGYNLDPKRTRYGAKILEPPREDPGDFWSMTVFCLFARGKSNVSLANAGMMLLVTGCG
jgi:hypothetical protein